MRGGRCRGLVLQEKDLPRTQTQCDAILLGMAGCPDPWNTGLNAAVNSKAEPIPVAIVRPSHRDQIDIDFVFGLIDPVQAKIYWAGNNADLTAAVALFCIEEGLTSKSRGSTRIRLWQTNLGQRIDAVISTPEAQLIESPSFQQEGVIRPGIEVALEFFQVLTNPNYEILGREFLGVLPSGQVNDTLQVLGMGAVDVSIFDLGITTVFVRPIKSPASRRAKRASASISAEFPTISMANLKAIRSAVKHYLDWPVSSPLPIRIVLIDKPRAYTSSYGVTVNAEEVDLLTQSFENLELETFESAEQALTVGAAAAIAGTVVNQIARTLPGIATRIGQTCGVVAVGADVNENLIEGKRGWTVQKVTISRGARRLLSGVAHLD